MMIFMYVCIVVFTVAQSASTKLYIQTNDNVVAFNTVKSVAAFLLFAIISFAGFQFHVPTLIYGCLYGLLLSVSMYAGYKALATGPMALTSLCVSFSVMIPLIGGVLWFDETLNIFNIVGFVFLIVAIVFVNLKKKSTSEENKGSLKWSIYVLLTFLANGFSSILQKSHQISYRGLYCSEFMMFTMLVCSLFFAGASLLKISKKTALKKEELKYGSIAGILNVLASYLTTRLAGFENASILFPAISAGTILCTLFTGVVVFKEKLKYNHFIAIGAGIAAVVFLKI